MKNLFFAFFTAFFAAFFAAGPASANVDPSSVQIKILAMALSPNVDCSNPLLISSFPSGKTVEFMSSSPPNLGGGFIPTGAYPCVVLQMSDVITFTPATSEGSCTAGVPVTRDVCRPPRFYTAFTVSGTTITYGANTGCNGAQNAPVEDDVPLFLSTASTTSGNGAGSVAFQQPTTSATGVNLNGAFVVGGSSAGTFVVDFHGRVDGSGATCDLKAPTFSFR